MNAAHKLSLRLLLTGRLLAGPFLFTLSLTPRGSLIADSVKARPREEPKPLSGSITARKQEFDLDENQVHAEGNVRMEYADMQLESDTLDVDLKAQSIEASGNVRVKARGGLLEGNRFLYRFGTREGSLDTARVTFERAVFQGKQLELKGDEVAIRAASVTTCSRETNPHYRVTCRSLVVQPGKQARLNHVTLWLGSHRILTVPKHVVSLAKAKPTRARLVPKPAVSGTDGLLLQSGFNYPLSKNPAGPEIEFELGLSTKRGFRGGAELSVRSEHVEYGINYATREVLRDLLTSKVFLDKTPEVFFNLRNYPIGRKLMVDVSTSAGNFREEKPFLANSSRTNLAVRLTPDFGSPSHPSAFFGSAFARKSWYDHGQDYEVLGVAVGLRGKLAKRIEGSIQYIAHDIGGATPFRFDLIEIKREVLLDTNITLSERWKIPFQTYYDLDRHSFPKKRFGLLRSLDCLDYGLTYDTARKEFSVEARLRGLEP
ncbi:MAG: LPS-assembly protein LptD [Armatimonadetes bacterium]|nr:LPS-assembly protein LptD [Armatimonadota bacterium]